MSVKTRWRKDRNAWFLIRHENGRKIQRRLGPGNSDRRRGEAIVREEQKRRLRGTAGLVEPRSRPIPFDAFALDWLERKVELPARQRAEGHLAPSTVTVNGVMVRLHLVPHLGRIDLRDIKVSTIDDLVAVWLKSGRPKSKRSRQIALNVLSQILAHAEADEIISGNPVRRWKATQPKGRASAQPAQLADWKVLTREEREHLLTMAEEVAPDYAEFILFLAESGCRVGEALSLNWDDVDLESGYATVTRQKTGGNTTEVELSSRLRAALTGIRPDICPAGTPAFRTSQGHRINAQNFRRRVWNPLVRAALGPARRFTIHCLRHTWASIHLHSGTPVTWITEQGGWSGSKVLLDTYGHALRGETTRFSDQLNVEDGPTRTQATDAG